MDADEIVSREMQGYRMGVVLDFLAERVGQAREAAHVHPHRQIATFDVAGADMVWVGCGNLKILIGA